MNLILALRYAVLDLKRGSAALALFLACLFLGVTGITGVQVLSRDLTAGIQSDGQRILGGDFALSGYAPLDATVLDRLKTLGAISQVVDSRAMLLNQQKEKTSLVDLKAVDSAYPLFGAVTVLDNTAPITQLLSFENGTYGALIESSLLQRLDVKTGDILQLGDAVLRVTGVLDKEPDRVSGMNFSLAPRLLISTAAFDASNLGGIGSRADYRVRVRLNNAPSLDGVEALAENLRTEFKDSNLRIRTTQNASPQTQRVIDRLTLFLTLIGLATLLVGGVGIGNAVKSFLDTRLTRIAIFKSVGAAPKFVFKIYMLQILILATFGIIAGMVAGHMAAHLAGQILSSRLDVPVQATFHPEAVGIAAVFGFLTVLLFSLPPLMRAVGVKPSQLFRDTVATTDYTLSKKLIATLCVLTAVLMTVAIASAPVARFAVYFCAFAAVTFIIFFLAARLVQWALRFVPRQGRPALRLAVANLTRPGNTTLGVVLSLGLGLTVLIAIAGVESNFTRLLRDDITTDRPSFYFLDIPPQEKEKFAQTILALPSAKHLVMTPNLRGRIISVNGVDAEKALVDRTEEWVIRSDRGFTISAKQPPHSTLTQGQWWPENYQGPAQVSIATDVARAFDIGIGDELTILVLGMPVTAKIANVRDIDWASFAMNFAVTFAPGTLDKAPATWLATVAVAPEEEEKMQALLAKEFPGVTSIRVREALDIAQGLIRMVAEAVRYSALLTLLSGVLVLAGSIAAANRRHIYDAVVLKVLGARRRDVLKTFLLEYGILGLVTVTIAGVLGVLASYSILTFILDLPWVFAAKAPVIAGLGSLLLTLIAGFIGTWHALGQKTAIYLRNT